MSSSSSNLSTDSAVSTRTTGWWFEEFRNQSMSDFYLTRNKDHKNDFEMNRSTSIEMIQERYPAVSRLKKGSCEPCSCCICFFCFFMLLAIGFVIYALINAKIIKFY
jgi:hypothetical protein